VYNKFTGYNPFPAQQIVDDENDRTFIFDPNPIITLTLLAKHKGRKNSQRHKNFR
jgi:hypothetical protein